ncbi:hypothetical protein BADSM9389_40120 [Buttiauxella agrestis]|nr:hypothetical protein BADSM9389_40120 [Buttiauxella agrestis]
MATDAILLLVSILGQCCLNNKQDVQGLDVYNHWTGHTLNEIALTFYFAESLHCEFNHRWN